MVQEGDATCADCSPPSCPQGWKSCKNGEVTGLELEPSLCKKILAAPDQVFCPSDLCGLFYRAGIDTHILSLLNQFLQGPKGKCHARGRNS